MWRISKWDTCENELQAMQRARRSLMQHMQRVHAYAALQQQHPADSQNLTSYFTLTGTMCTFSTPGLSTRRAFVLYFLGAAAEAAATAAASNRERILRQRLSHWLSRFDLTPSP